MAFLSDGMGGPQVDSFAQALGGGEGRVKQLRQESGASQRGRRGVRVSLLDFQISDFRGVLAGSRIG